jgi:hypothetical protein
VTAPAAPEADPATPEAQRARLSTVRERLAGSPLVRGGGLLRTRILAPATLAALVRDAVEAHRSAAEARVGLEEDRPRGDPDRWLESATGGAALQAFAASEEVRDLLVRSTGVGWVPAGPGSWSYYRRAGHHLGLHRDLAVCDLALVTCVVDEGAEAGSGLLRLWPGRAREPLEAVRRDPRGSVDVRLAAGQSALLLGGVVPHQVLPLRAGHVRIVAPLCYQAVPCDC